MPTRPDARLLAALLFAAAGSTASAQLRVAAWNISSYGTMDGREPAFKTMLYSSYQSRKFAPDIVIAQELLNPVGAANFLAVLNDTSAGSPGDWAMAPFTQGPDTSLAFYYRNTRVTYISQVLVLAGGNVNGAPRDIRRYDVRLSGYTSAGASLAIYGDHMKAGEGCCATGSDQARRLIEATAIRNNANALPADWHFIFGGDTNIQSSNQSAYQQMIGSLANNRGRFFDPINTPGTWNDTMSFRFVHTQAPGTRGVGMDDRFDFVLLDSGLVDGTGFDYIGNPAIPYSTITWNDPNHSFRAWGNDGSTYNDPINTGNAMVGPTIAQAIIDACQTDASGGHLPVFLDLRVPPRVAAIATIDFGQVEQNSVAQEILNVANGGDVAKWTAAGIANLGYTLAATPGFAVPGGPFTATPGGIGNNHLVGMNTSNLGPITGTITIASNSPDEPSRIVNLQGEVIPPAPPACYANCDGSTEPPILNANDFSCFLNAFAAASAYANCDESTVAPVLNANDFSCFLNAFAAGCT